MTKPVLADSKHVLKNMLIAVITSVIGATAIYFLGFNNQKPSLSEAQKEEATLDTWSTYVTIENIYTQSAASLLQDAAQFGNYANVSQESSRDSKKFQTGLQDLIATDGVDKSLVSFLKKRLENDKKRLAETEKFYKGLEDVIILAKKQNWITGKSGDTLSARITRFAEETKAVFTEPVPGIEELSKKLSEKYDQPFSVNELLIFQAVKYNKDIFTLTTEKKGPELSPNQPGNKGVNAGTAGEPVKATKQYLTGKWNTGNGATISLKADGKLTWLIPASNTEVNGNWQFKNDQLVMNIKKHPVTGKDATWIFNLSDVMTTAFTIILSTPPSKTYTLVRQ
jgi:hypothetical protein